MDIPERCIIACLCYYETSTNVRSSSMLESSLMPRPYLLRGKRVWWIWTVSLVWPALRARTDTAVLKQISDLIGQQGCAGASRQFNLYSKQWCLRLASHMTVLKLQSDWNTQIPFPGQGLLSIFTRPLFSHWGWGLGTRLAWKIPSVPHLNVLSSGNVDFIAIKTCTKLLCQRT